MYRIHWHLCTRLGTNQSRPNTLSIFLNFNLSNTKHQETRVRKVEVAVARVDQLGENWFHFQQQLVFPLATLKPVFEGYIPRIHFKFPKQSSLLG